MKGGFPSLPLFRLADFDIDEFSHRISEERRRKKREEDGIPDKKICTTVVVYRNADITTITQAGIFIFFFVGCWKLTHTNRELCSTVKLARVGIVGSRQFFFHLSGILEQNCRISFSSRFFFSS